MRKRQKNPHEDISSVIQCNDVKIGQISYHISIIISGSQSS